MRDGVTTMREMVDNARRIAMAVDIPVFSDADTGYGNAVQVYRTVQEFIQAGVGGIHIEDQESPKKSGSMAGRRCISVEEMVGKLRAALQRAPMMGSGVKYAIGEQGSLDAVPAGDTRGIGLLTTLASNLVF